MGNWILKKNYDTEVEKKLKMYDNINRTINREEIKLKKLTDLLLEEIISNDEYKNKKVSLIESIERLKVSK